MADYSKTIEEIRRNNKKLEEEERKTPEERDEEKKQQKMSLIRDKVISYLLETIKKYQHSKKKRVTEIYLMEDRHGNQEIGVRVVDEFTREYYKKSSISFKKVFGGRTIKKICEAFELKGNMHNIEVADGFFSVILQGDNFSPLNLLSTDFYNSYTQIYLRFHVRY